MKFFLGLFGLVMMAIGVLMWVRPSVFQGLARGVERTSTRLSWAYVDLSFGVLLIWGAGVSRSPIFIRILGGLCLLEGLILLLAPKNFLINILQWWDGLSEGTRRVWGVFTLILGVLVLITL